MPIGSSLNAMPLPELYRSLASGGLPRRLFELARDEDLGDVGDLTSDLIAVRREDAVLDVSAVVRARRGCVVAGLESLDELRTVFGLAVEFERIARDGDRVRSGDAIVRVAGPRAAITTIERTMLNTLGRLSGVATRTAEYVAEASRGGPARICDTRKTTPGLRSIEKYAVRCGGGWLHRLGLHDAVMLKDNHVAGLAPVAFAELACRVAIDARSRLGEHGFVEVEVDTLDQLRALADAEFEGIDAVLLDNMANSDLREACAIRDGSGGAGVELEASGGVSLDTIAGIAATGVDRISVGAMTHGAVWADLGLDDNPA